MHNKLVLSAGTAVAALAVGVLVYSNTQSVMMKGSVLAPSAGSMMSSAGGETPVMPTGTTGGMDGGTTGGTAPVTCKNAPKKSVKKVVAPKFLDNFTGRAGPEPVEATAKKQVSDSIAMAAMAKAKTVTSGLKATNFTCPDAGCEVDVINAYYAPAAPTLTYMNQFADGSLKVTEYSADATCKPKLSTPPTPTPPTTTSAAACTNPPRREGIDEPTHTASRGPAAQAVAEQEARDFLAAAAAAHAQAKADASNTATPFTCAMPDKCEVKSVKGGYTPKAGFPTVTYDAGTQIASGTLKTTVYADATCGPK